MTADNGLVQGTAATTTAARLVGSVVGAPPRRSERWGTRSTELGAITLGGDR